MEWFDSIRRIFSPGLGLKRWLVVAFVGLFQISIGATIWLRGLLNRLDGPLASLLSLSFIPRLPRGLLVLGSGIAMTAVGWRRLSRSLVRVMMPERPESELADVLIERQRAVRGRRVVVIGGEPGLSPTLRALQALQMDIRVEVILTDFERGYVAQELRNRFGLSGPQVIYPIADDAQLYAELEDGRIIEGASTINNYRGGPLKDVFWSRNLRRVQVWEADNEERPLGETLRAYTPNLSDDALEALERAEMILFAPGRIYTQVIPNLTLPRFAQAVRESRATRVLIANLMTEPGRTDGWTVSDHLEEIHRITGVTMDYAVVHHGQISDGMLAQYHNEGADVVRLELEDEGMSRLIFADTGEEHTLLDGAVILVEDLVTEEPQIVTFERNGDKILREMPVVRHDPRKVADVLKRLLAGKA